MKYITSVIVGVLFIILFTFILTPLVNDAYVAITGLEPGPDGESKLLDLLVFVQWPIYFFIGSISGWFIHKKYLTKSSSGR
ncbi:MAG: hypothetical protein KZQ89_05280 [Candidatus Thiodiazotropha sp. (ex Lucinoma kastoroae)]|nr:hypothetical protein [Candidatus Thiodiazotropha sp. (ex Lucinoma kastoroae)]